MSILIACVVGWVACGVLAYGLTFAALQRQCPARAREDYKQNRLLSILFGVCGPAGLLSAAFVILGDGRGFRHGIKFR